MYGLTFTRRATMTLAATLLLAGRGEGNLLFMSLQFRNENFIRRKRPYGPRRSTMRISGFSSGLSRRAYPTDLRYSSTSKPRSSRIS
jgi:hypothetical protein